MDRTRRGSAAERGYDSRWQRARIVFLAANPLCRPCGLKSPPQVTAATVVDHVVDHKGDSVLFWDERNWQPSCEACHNARVDAGDFGRPRSYPGVMTLDTCEAENVTDVRRPRWRRHRSARSIVKAWFDSLARSAGVSLGGWDHGQVATFRLEVRCAGAWAFCTPRTRTIHYWFEQGLAFEQLVHMLGHELGHMVSDRKNWSHVRAPREEVRADLYGAVAAVAVKEASRVFRTKRRG